MVYQILDNKQEAEMSITGEINCDCRCHGRGGGDCGAAGSRCCNRVGEKISRELSPEVAAERVRIDELIAETKRE